MITPSKEFWGVFKKTNGALSCCEALAIMNVAALAPEGRCIELGTYMGKSAMSAMYSRPSKSNFILVDPEFSDKTFYDNVLGVLIPASKNGAIALIDDYSINGVIEKYAPYSYIFVDSGSHQDGLPMQEVKLLEDRVISGGIVAFHDFRSQFTEVEIAYNYLLSTNKYDEIKINWNEIIQYVKENNLEEGNVSWHHTELEFPCFVGALKKR